MDMVERLNWMDEHYLSHFEKIDVEANISLQESFAAPREAVKPYSITESAVSYTHLDVYKRQVVVVVGIRGLISFIEQRRVEDERNALFDQPGHMTVGKLCRVTFGFAGNGFDAQ